MLLFKKIFKSLTLDDLPNISHNLSSLRQKASVLIIDDQEFVYESSLRNAQFNLTVHHKWHDIKDVEPYDVIVSDNHGVVDLPDGSDGLTMVNEGRKLYPDKNFALYSGNLLDIRDHDAEGLIIRTKGDSVDVWTSMLDDLIKDCYDPRRVWEKIRRILAKSDMSEKEMRRMQHYYVLSVLKQKSQLSNHSWDLDKETLSLIIRIAGLAISAARLSIAL